MVHSHQASNSMTSTLHLPHSIWCVVVKEVHACTEQLTNKRSAAESCSLNSSDIRTMCMWMQSRPFGVALLIAGNDDGGPVL